MKRKAWIITIIMLFGLFLIAPVWAADPSQPSSPMRMPSPPGKGTGITGGGGMMGGMGMMHGKAGARSGKGIVMHGRKAGRIGYRTGMGMGIGLMGPFHRWMKGFMAHQSLFDLSSEQMNKLEGLLLEHLKYAIRGQAEIRVLQVDLMQKLREDPLETKAVEDLLKKISEEQTGLQVEGVHVYSQVLQLLNDQQKAKVKETIGSPFCTPWESMMLMGGDIDMPSGEEAEEPGGSSEAESAALSEN